MEQIHRPIMQPDMDTVHTLRAYLLTMEELTTMLAMAIIITP
jgi:hypothetical protein